MLKRRWKNLRDGMMRCLKKISDGQKSGAGATKIPTCKFFKQLVFLRDFVSNRETESNINVTPMNIPNNQMQEQKTESAAQKSVRFTTYK